MANDQNGMEGFHYFNNYEACISVVIDLRKCHHRRIFLTLRHAQSGCELTAVTQYSVS